MLLVMSCDQHIVLDGEMFSFQPVCETPASKNLGPSTLSLLTSGFPEISLLNLSFLLNRLIHATIAFTKYTDPDEVFQYVNNASPVRLLYCEVILPAILLCMYNTDCFTMNLWLLSVFHCNYGYNKCLGISVLYICVFHYTLCTCTCTCMLHVCTYMLCTCTLCTCNFMHHIV